MMEEISKER